MSSSEDSSQDEIPEIIAEYGENEKAHKKRHVEEKDISLTDLTAKALYSNIKKKKKAVRSPSFNNFSDFEESVTSHTSASLVSMQLIKISENGIEMCEEAMKYLSTLHSKVAVVSIGGPARTGKSLLLNLLTQKNTFEVGSRIQACTQGIWITPIKQVNKTVILVDSEGCKSIEKSGTFDAKLFALLILMSSVFVYNSKGVIDEQSISQLALATHISEMISFNLRDEDQKQTKKRVSSLAPKFIWLLRDFHLSLVDQDENAISPKQYMENILGMKKFYGRNAEKNGKIREKILEIFEDRHCFTLPRPADQESDLENLSALPRSSLRPKFLKAFEGVESMLLEKSPVKKIKGAKISGFQLLHFIEQIVICLNQGIMPNIHTVWSKVIEKQYEQFLEDAKVKYTELREISVEDMPYEENELIYKLQMAKDSALEGLREMEQIDEGHEEYVREEFEIFFEDDLKFTSDANSSSSEAYNLSLIERLFGGIIKNLHEGKFKDDFERFESEWLEKMKEYEQLARGPGKTSVIIEFSKKHQHNSFSEFFQNTTDEYAQEIADLKKKNEEFQINLYEKFKGDKELMIDEHVRNK